MAVAGSWRLQRIATTCACRFACCRLNASACRAPSGQDEFAVARGQDDRAREGRTGSGGVTLRIAPESAGRTGSGDLRLRIAPESAGRTGSGDLTLRIAPESAGRTGSGDLTLRIAPESAGRTGSGGGTGGRGVVPSCVASMFDPRGSGGGLGRARGDRRPTTGLNPSRAPDRAAVAPSASSDRGPCGAAQVLQHVGSRTVASGRRSK
jgi:hypothetical protein